MSTDNRIVDDDAAAALLPLGEGDGRDLDLPLRFHVPGTDWSWYPTEYDGNDVLFGYVQGHYPEWGYFSAAELEEVGAVKDPDHTPCPVSSLGPAEVGGP